MRNMEDSFSQNSISLAMVNAIVVVISIAFIYWLICMITPELSKSSVLGVYFGKSIKLANMLRAFLLVSPAVVIGTGIGAWLFNMSTGTSGVSAYPILPFILTAVGLAFYKISQKYGRSIIKDLIILTIFGFISSLIVTLNLMATSILVGDIALKIITPNIIWRLFIGTLTILAGYPFVLIYEQFNKKLGEK